MEEAAAAASAAAAAAKDAALSASVAAAAAAKDAAVAAATAKEATAAAKDAAVAASAAALNAEKAAATASAAALNAKEAAAVAVSAGEAAAAAATTAAAAMQASKKRKFNLIEDDQDTPVSEDVDDGETGNIDDGETGNVDDGGSVDLISRLPEAVLCRIVSLLPTKEAARTQAISRRWHPLWRSAPLNLVADFDSKSEGTIDLISKILSEHPGPARRFSFSLCISDCSDKIEGWLSSQALNNLQELELTYYRLFDDREKLYPLPLSVYRFAPTLRVAKFQGCHFPNLIVTLSLKFPCLNQLTMETVTISEDALQSFFSGCPALESLELKKKFGIGRLCISSQSLKSLGFSSGWRNEGLLLQELVIEDAPCLERLLPLDPQKLIDVGLTTKIHSMRVLVLDSVGPNLDVVVNFLKCFPCLERLYVMLQPGMIMNNVRKYDPLDPVECLELHLKKVVLKNYDGTKSPSIDFAKFFVLNAKVLKEMKITLPYHRQYKWFANQHELLRIKDRASQDARIELKCGTKDYFTHNKHTHDLPMADPFDMPSSRCSKCS
ncbi:putative FBD-associated F-box protein At5g44940 [Lolium rigidum]|uniref:putative FBD-associated F-box protein At5g44940 n=1 Tax=Lolium rigidum TaxID=89674 RepID=UPI001F5D9C53|nr:putative FBD-associated F-box protein At5g44940 [Lolium rigidum]